MTIEEIREDYAKAAMTALIAKYGDKGKAITDRAFVLADLMLESSGRPLELKPGYAAITRDIVSQVKAGGRMASRGGLYGKDIYILKVADNNAVEWVKEEKK